MEMANNNKLESTEEVNYKMRRSFSWNRAFFTSDGFLAAEELSSMIEGGVDDVKHELQKIEELESMEAKLFQEIEASTQKSTGTSNLTNSGINLSSRKRDSQAKKVTGERAPVKTPPKRSSPVSGGSPGNNVKTLARRSTSSKTGKANADSPSKTPPRITTKNKEASINTRISRTSPASPVSPGSSGSSSSTFAVSQRSKRSGNVPRRSTVNNEKPSATDARRSDDWKSSKPAVSLMPKSQSSISLKIKPPPVISHPSSPSRQTNSSSSSTTQRQSESSSSTCTVDQRLKSRGIKGSTVHHTSKPTLKNHHIGQASDPKGKQPAITCKTGSTNGSKTVAAANAGLKPNSRKATTPKKQSRSTENILVISPELLDLQSKINALKMEISMHKKDRCNKMARAEGDEGNLKTPFAIEECSL
ncbi:hypothetical protein L1987_34794 [Smallanthus sonchifolius]|uniref:Uncharacterized protein n=1 Tax=Smallanthus sonchifolius TaxID=185202 RepID=A0ACB9HW84_9ASTR|nr:hypothetical protein L1987_34794 [Smallanthus sonchifolius]